MDYESYSRIQAVNWSTLKELGRSPLHYRHRLQHPKPDTKATAVGRGVHAAVFEQFRLAQDFVTWEGGVRRGKKWDAFVAASTGRTILTAAEANTVNAIAAAVAANPIVREYTAKGRGEVTLQWTDAETDLPCKARADWISDSKAAIVDLKTTQDISERAFQRTLAKMRYHCQMAYYRDGERARTGVALPCVLVAVESQAPHDVAVYEIDEDSLYAGFEEYAGLLRKLRDCRQADQWPGQFQTAMPLRLPAWCWEDDEAGTDADGLGLTVGTPEDET